MANVLANINVGAGSSGLKLASLSSRNGLGKSSSQPRLSIGTSKETSENAVGRKQICSSRRRMGNPKKKKGSLFQSQTSGRHLEGVSTLDSHSEDDQIITLSETASGIAERAIQLTVNKIELEEAMARSRDYGSVSSPESIRLMAQPMDAKSRAELKDKHPYHNLEVAPRWREIQGENRWAGMLDPMDPVLRGEIIRYGEFAQATYDAFDYNSHSPHCGSCKYNKNRLLQGVGLENRGYEVTDYLYATAGKDHPVANLLRKIDFDVTDDIDPEEVWDPESNWTGFVAVCTDPEEIARLGRRDIVVVWRGTVTNLEWLQNVTNFLAPTGFDPRRSGEGIVDLKVEAGFLQLYKARDETSRFSNKSAREQVLDAVRRLVHQYRFEELSITVTGHSLGSALAKLCAYDIAESCLNVRLKHHDEVHTITVPDWEDPNGLAPHVEKHIDEHTEAELGSIPITVFSFAGPRVGNDAFRDRMEELGVKVLRVVNKHDMVPTVPGLVFNERLEFLEDKVKPFWKWLDSLPWTYTHVGVKLELDNLRSPFLKKTKNPVDTHNLEAYLHLVVGYHGPGREFELAIARDIALVNKACNLLKPSYYIPPHWYQEENKGLMRTSDGKWIPRLRHPEDLPHNHL